MNNASKYMAMVFELPAIMLALAYGLDTFDGPQHRMGGYGGLIGMIAAIVLWLVHVMFLIKNSEND